jgi:hypothetical protein
MDVHGIGRVYCALSAAAFLRIPLTGLPVSVTFLRLVVVTAANECTTVNVTARKLVCWRAGTGAPSHLRSTR